MNIIFYSTGCPKCKVLKNKLDAKGLEYTVIEDVDEMAKAGLRSAPALQIDDKPIMKYFDAVKWVNALEV